MHLNVLPLPVVHALVAPDVGSVSLDVVIVELALVGGSIRPEESAPAVLLALLVLSQVLGTI